MRVSGVSQGQPASPPQDTAAALQAVGDAARDNGSLGEARRRKGQSGRAAGVRCDQDTLSGLWRASMSQLPTSPRLLFRALPWRGLGDSDSRRWVKLLLCCFCCFVPKIHLQGVLEHSLWCPSTWGSGKYPLMPFVPLIPTPGM